MSAVLDRQVAALLARVREHAAAAMASLEREAAAQSAAVLADARREARARMRAAFREQRARVAERLRRAAAEAETRARIDAFSREHDLLEQARAALAGALAARWARPDTRRAWCEGALDVAARTLVAREWRVATATGLGAAERDALAARAVAAGARVMWDAADPPPLGLRVVAAGGCVDATPDGLLADPADVDARLLAAAAAASEAR